jgi:hypothetical protein
MSKYVKPEFGLESFTCPFCDVVSRQDWYSSPRFVSRSAKETKEFLETGGCVPVYNGNYTDLTFYPRTFLSLGEFDTLCKDPRKLYNISENLMEWLRDYLTTSTFLETRPSKPNFEGSEEAHDFIIVSSCHNCGNISIWLRDKLIHPKVLYGPPASQYMPEAVASFYNEARSVYDSSKIGTIALLRLAIETLCKILLTDSTSSDMLGTLIARMKKENKVPENILRLLDGYRAMGNSGVHAGYYYAEDIGIDPDRLFNTINRIVDKTIGELEDDKLFDVALEKDNERKEKEKQGKSK